MPTTQCCRSLNAIIGLLPRASARSRPRQFRAARSPPIRPSVEAPPLALRINITGGARSPPAARSPRCLPLAHSSLAGAPRAHEIARRSLVAQIHLASRSLTTRSLGLWRSRRSLLARPPRKRGRLPLAHRSWPRVLPCVCRSLAARSYCPRRSLASGYQLLRRSLAAPPPLACRSLNARSPFASRSLTARSSPICRSLSACSPLAPRSLGPIYCRLVARAPGNRSRRPLARRSPNAAHAARSSLARV